MNNMRCPKCGEALYSRNHERLLRCEKCKWDGYENDIDPFFDCRPGYFNADLLPPRTATEAYALINTKITRRERGHYDVSTYIKTQSKLIIHPRMIPVGCPNPNRFKKEYYDEGYIERPTGIHW